MVEDLISCTSVILSHQNNAEFLIIFLYQLQSFGAGPLFQSVLFLSVWSSWQGWCSLFMTRGHRRLGISVSPSNRYLYYISAHTTFNFDQLDIINIVVIFNIWTIYKTDLSRADIWIWRRMMEAAPNWFPKGGKANQTDPALVWSTPSPPSNNPHTDQTNSQTRHQATQLILIIFISVRWRTKKKFIEMLLHFIHSFQQEDF